MLDIRKRVSSATHKTEALAEAGGNTLVYWFHLLALFAIGGAIVWSAADAFIGMIGQGGATVEDILLLFIYLELGAMVGIYFKTNHMPVRFLIYVAMTALTRMLIGFINVETTVERLLNQGILFIAGAILLLAFAILVLRYGSHRFPSLATAPDQPDAAETNGDA